MTRLPDWRVRLHAYLDACRSREFDWATWHCGLFALGGVEAMTGVRPIVGVSGRFSTQLGALRVMRRAGFADVGEVAASVLQEASRAREGDVAVVYDLAGAQALGIAGRGVVHCLSPGIGLWASSERPVRAFAVPFPSEQQS